MSNEYIRNPSDVLGFFTNTCKEQGLFVDTDKGFLKADNTSAFASIADEEAQKAQKALQESIEVLAQFDVDAWEVMVDIAFREATLRHVRQRTHSMHTVEFIEILTTERQTMECGQVEGFAYESAERRNARHATFIMNTIQNIQQMHPELAQRGKKEMGNYNVFMIAQDLFPALVHNLAKWACETLEGTTAMPAHASAEQMNDDNFFDMRAKEAMFQAGIDEWDDETPNWGRF